MTDPSPAERRALAPDELELVSAARHPTLNQMSEGELAELVRALRARIAAGEPAGAVDVGDAEETLSREHFLGAALSRAEDEARKRKGAPQGNP